MQETKSLLIETSTGACSVAANCDGRISTRHELTERAHSRLILPMVRSCLDELGLSLAALDFIGFGAGPGSFTGVRIATATAQGLALAVSKPLVAVSSLAGVAQGVLNKYPEARVLVAQDARMDEVYAGGYRLVNSVATTYFDDCVIPPGLLPEDPQALLAGDAWERLDSLHALTDGREITALHPVASDMLAIARHRFQSGQRLSATEAEPQYLRNQVARKA